MLYCRSFYPLIGHNKIFYTSKLFLGLLLNPTIPLPGRCNLAILWLSLVPVDLIWPCLISYCPINKWSPTNPESRCAVLVVCWLIPALFMWLIFLQNLDFLASNASSWFCSWSWCVASFFCVLIGIFDASSNPVKLLLHQGFTASRFLN